MFKYSTCIAQAEKKTVTSYPNGLDLLYAWNVMMILTEQWLCQIKKPALCNYDYADRLPVCKDKALRSKIRCAKREEIVHDVNYELLLKLVGSACESRRLFQWNSIKHAMHILCNAILWLACIERYDIFAKQQLLLNTAALFCVWLSQRRSSLCTFLFFK